MGIMNCLPQSDILQTVWGHHPSCPVRRRATEGTTEKGRGLSEGRSPEFRSPRCGRVAQGTPQGRRTGLCFFASFLAQARKGVACRGESRRERSVITNPSETAPSPERPFILRYLRTNGIGAWCKRRVKTYPCACNANNRPNSSTGCGRPK